VSGPWDHRRPRSEDKTVEVPLRGPRKAEPSPSVEEPWWKNANKRVPPPPQMPPPRMPAPPAAPRTPQPPVQRRERPPTPARNRHAKTTARRSGGQVALLVAVGVIAISAGAVGLIVGLSSFEVTSDKVLDVSKAEAGVQRILVNPVEGYGATNVSDVVCNNGDDPKINKGATFTCSVVVDGRKREVLVVFQDDDGTYEVDRPR
jgi:Domain of unknown function (DUF4333)